MTDSNLWINVFNPNVVSFFNDPGFFFDIPLVFKPTLMNMDYPHEAMKVPSFLQNNRIDCEELTYFLGTHLDWNKLGNIVFDNFIPNQ